MTGVQLGEWRFDSVEYDREADVLYLSIGDPRPGVGEETSEGHILRFDEDGEFCGLTLIGVQALLDGGRDVDVTLPRRLPKRAHLASTDLRRVLA